MLYHVIIQLACTGRPSGRCCGQAWETQGHAVEINPMISTLQPSACYYIDRDGSRRMQQPIPAEWYPGSPLGEPPSSHIFMNHDVEMLALCHWIRFCKIV
jgi:hypothetical protein